MNNAWSNFSLEIRSSFSTPFPTSIIPCRLLSTLSLRKSAVSLACFIRDSRSELRSDLTEDSLIPIFLPISDTFMPSFPLSRFAVATSSVLRASFAIAYTVRKSVDEYPRDFAMALSPVYFLPVFGSVYVNPDLRISSTLLTKSLLC